MSKIHKIYCITGRTASGKSTITKLAAERLGMSILKSYTTREMRKGEEIESDHTFISTDDVDKYKNSMVAYTERFGYCSFATKEQLLQNDFYIINPTGYYELLLKTKGMNIEFVAIYITVPYRKTAEMAKRRGDFDSWKENYDKEDHEFKDYEKSNMIHYRVLNNGSIEESVEKLIHIIEKDRKAKH